MTEWNFGILNSLEENKNLEKWTSDGDGLFVLANNITDFDIGKT